MSTPFLDTPTQWLQSNVKVLSHRLLQVCIHLLFFYSAFLTDAAATFLKEIPCVFSVMFMFSVLYISSTGSHDTTIRLWDLVAGKTRATLTNHKKSVRALVLHPRQ